MKKANGFAKLIILAAVVILLGGWGAKFIEGIKNRFNLNTEQKTEESSGPVETPDVDTSVPISSQPPIQTGEEQPAVTKTYQINKAGNYWRDLIGWESRPYLVHAPSGYDSSKPMPVVIALHGGGGNAEAMAKVSCPGGDLNNSKCLDKLADREGFIVIYPNGTSNPLFKDSRTFNAGGGSNGYACISRVACPQNINDVAYVNSLLDDAEVALNIDTRRIYVTGMSNGAAMSHRLACQLPNRITAIAAVGGGNQFSALNNCSPTRGVPILQIHGTADPAWPYNGGVLAGGALFDDGNVISVDDTISGWVKRNTCSATPSTQNLQSTVSDGTSVTKFQYSGCRNNATVVLYKINNGGHSWPQGNPYLKESVIGITSQQINANNVIWNFVKNYSR